MNTKDGERSGYSIFSSLPDGSDSTQLTSAASPDMPPTPATSHQLRRTISEETLATTISDVSSSLSLKYPNAPLNTPATQSIAGDDLKTTAADIENLADRLQHTTPPISPVSPSQSTGEGCEADSLSGEGHDDNDDPFKEGKAHLRAHVREDAELGRQLFKSPERKRPLSKHELLRKYAGNTDRSITPTRLSFVTVAAAAATATPTGPPTFEHTTWGSVAEEDTERALKRMAMLARDEHQKDPRHTVEEYYSMRLAKLIEEAEVSFDATHLH
jgi:hypothetical protein